MAITGEGGLGCSGEGVEGRGLAAGRRLAAGVDVGIAELDSPAAMAMAFSEVVVDVPAGLSDGLGRTVGST